MGGRQRRVNRYGSRFHVEQRPAPEWQKKIDKPREVEIRLPARLDLDGNYDATVKALNKVRLASERKLRLQYLNFDDIRYISPSAALLLASEVNRWKDSIGGRMGARDSKWDPVVKRLLCEMGLFELLCLDRPPGSEKLINTTFLPFMRGDVDDRTNAGSKAKELRQQIDAVAGTEIRHHLLFDGLTEAVTNVCHHAYRKRGRRRKRYKPWWMSAAYVRDTNSVIVTFYDHGMTIPGTLPVSEKMERWRKRIGWWDDGQRIRAAMTLGRSSTGKSGRGKGLRNFLELIAGHKVSKLLITSRSGRLTVENPGNSPLRYRSQVLETSLRGTLIEWQFVPTTATDNLSDAHLDR